MIVNQPRLAQHFALNPAAQRVYQSDSAMMSRTDNLYQAPSDCFQNSSVRTSSLKFAGSADTTFWVENSKWADADAEVLVVPVYMQAAKKSDKDNFSYVMSPELKELDAQMGGVIQKAANRGKFNGAKGHLLFEVPTTANIKAQQVMLVGIGNKDQVKPNTIEQSIQAGLKALGSKVKSVAVVLPKSARMVSEDMAARSVVGAFHQSTYRTLQALPEKLPANIEHAVLLTDKQNQQPIWDSIEAGRTIEEAVSFAKDLNNAPYNAPDHPLNAATFAKAAQKLADSSDRLSVEIEKYEDNPAGFQKNYPGVYAVNKASLRTDPARVVTLKYSPKGPVKKKIALVGKTVVFDTGGYQDKGAAMNGMHMDMSGGGNVLAVMKALAKLQPEGVEVTAYFAATPNENGPDAYRTDDLFKTRSGKTFQVVHTDAEGRLTLIDMVTKANEGKPDEIITMATLTGAAAAAVGKKMALLTRDDEDSKVPQHSLLGASLYKTARKLGEPIQPLLIDGSHFEAIVPKGNDNADLVNAIPGAPAGAQTAAAFVMSGLKPDANDRVPSFAHFDIAGTMTNGAGFSGTSSGTGVKTLIYHILNSVSRK
ncbi:MAG TPA: M17 family peptidase N-terminal domain-containing protein [Coleofasciculaceae cyanobacterium]|jgi:leucyl aminopeptidase